MTPAQNAVFNNPTQENILPSDNITTASMPGGFKKYGVYIVAVVVILFLYKFLKR
jgi:hypothetical protein